MIFDLFVKSIRKYWTRQGDAASITTARAVFSSFSPLTPTPHTSTTHVIKALFWWSIRAPSPSPLTPSFPWQGQWPSSRCSSWEYALRLEWVFWALLATPNWKVHLYHPLPLFPFPLSFVFIFFRITLNTYFECISCVPSSKFTPKKHKAPPQFILHVMYWPTNFHCFAWCAFWQCSAMHCLTFLDGKKNPALRKPSLLKYFFSLPSHSTKPQEGRTSEESSKRVKQVSSGGFEQKNYRTPSGKFLPASGLLF